MSEETGAQVVYVDDFARPESDWPAQREPAYPFPFVRHAEFLACVRDLTNKAECSYRPFDWSTLQISNDMRIVKCTGPVIIEGVCSLDEDIASLYDLRFFVESDEQSILQTAVARGDGQWSREWHEYFLPSTEIYMRSNPRRRAEYLVAGRGA